MTITERIRNLFGLSAPATRARTFMDPALTAYFGAATSNAGVSVDEVSALNYLHTRFQRESHGADAEIGRAHV